jgi:hypothetical protein
MVRSQKCLHGGRRGVELGSELEIFFLSRVSRVKLGLLAGCQLGEEELPHGYSKSEPMSFSPFSSIQIPSLASTPEGPKVQG